MCFASAVAQQVTPLLLLQCSVPFGVPRITGRFKKNSQNPKLVRLVEAKWSLQVFREVQSSSSRGWSTPGSISP